MAKKKKKQAAKQLIVVGLALVALQLILYFYLGEDKQITAREAIERTVERQTDIAGERREIMKIQLAIEDYKASKQSLPGTLKELVPTYFDMVPIIPGTKEEFTYEVRNGTPYIFGKESPLKKGGTATGGTAIKTSEAASDLLIASLTENPEQVVVSYDPKGKRDPFVPFDLRPKAVTPTGATPLEQYAIGQLKLTAVLESETEPKANIENQAGRGYIAKKGMKIGINGGEIIEIHPDRIIILEKTVDFTGETKTTTIEMKLRTKDKEIVR